MATNVINAEEVLGMVQHWLNTPPNGYLGSSYGADVYSILQKPMLSGVGDILLAKMREDIPILDALPSGSLNVYLTDIEGSNDSRKLVFEVLGELITAG